MALCRALRFPTIKCSFLEPLPLKYGWLRRRCLHKTKMLSSCKSGGKRPLRQNKKSVTAERADKKTDDCCLYPDHFKKSPSRTAADKQPSSQITMKPDQHKNKHIDSKHTTLKCTQQYMTPECKVAIVTGGTTGIGFTAACHLLKNCARHVIITGQDREKGESAVEQLEELYGDNKVTYICGDVNNQLHFEGLFEMACEAFGGVDILFNNAGILQDAIWEQEVDTNVKGVLRGTLLAFKYMGLNRGGHGGLVINNSSVAGLVPFPSSPVYSITKFTVNGITLNFGHEYHYKETGIRVCSVCPGSTDTDMINTEADKQFTSEWGKETKRILHLKPQSASAVGQSIIHIIKYAPSASLWVISDSILKQVQLPCRHAISKLVKQFS